MCTPLVRQNLVCTPCPGIACVQEASWLARRAEGKGEKSVGVLAGDERAADRETKTDVTLKSNERKGYENEWGRSERERVDGNSGARGIGAAWRSAMGMTSFSASPASEQFVYKYFREPQILVELKITQNRRKTGDSLRNN